MTDFRGRTLPLGAPRTRIACLLESALSGLYMLGLKEEISAVPAEVYQPRLFKHYALLDERIKKRSLPAPGNWDFFNLEILVELKPDLVVLWAHQQEAIASLEALGLSVYGVQLESLADVKKEILDLGELTGRENRAQQLLELFQADLELSKNIAGLCSKKPTEVYFIWPQSVLDTACAKSTVTEVLKLAGVQNVCTLETERSVVSYEKVLHWNPDAIVLWPSEKQSIQSVREISAWRSVSAIEKGQVFAFSDPFVVDLWTLKASLAVRQIAAWLCPNAVEKMFTQAEQSKRLKAYYGVSSPL